MIHTDVCDRIGIEYPIFQGGMAWVSEHVLAAAVSNAGGLGIISAMNAPGEYLRKEIRACREMTDRPFGVNVMLMSPHAPEVAKVILEEKVPVVTTGAGLPGVYMKEWVPAGIKVVPVVPSVAIAKRVAREGATAVIAEGCESGGHVGELTTMALVPQVVDAVDVPVLAAGGIADGRGIAASFMLGARGVQVGTRFLCATECQVHPNYKKKILAARDIDTVVTGKRLGHPVRCLKNPFARSFGQMEYDSTITNEEIEAFGAGSLRKAAVEGDMENGSIMSGQIAALVKENSPPPRSSARCSRRRSTACGGRQMGKIAFVFAGQGAQYAGMGRELYEASPAARAAFDRAESLRPGTLEMCFSGPAEALSVTANTQPCLFAMDYACAAAAREAGVSPDCAAGFSLGEVAAMAFAGVMDFDEAFRFVIKRAEEMQSCAEKHPGAMGAVLRLTPAQVEDICRAFPDRAFPVNYNCPGQTVVACAVEVYDELAAKVTEARGRMLRLNVSGAFHTPWMEKAAEALRAYLADKPTRVPELPLYANATAQPYGDDAAQLLSTQVCHPVRWQESVERMAEAGVDTFIEVGAGKTLSGLIRKTIPGAAIFNVEKPEDLQKLSEVRA